MYLYIRSEMEKMRCFTIFKIKACFTLDVANPLYHVRVLSIYTIYVSGNPGRGGGGVKGRGNGIQ